MFSFEKMGLGHLERVVEIENESFPSPWYSSTFASEILENEFAHYIVVLLKEQVVGYAGMWLVLDEAHITNVAVHRDFRRRKIGMSLMLEIIRRSALLGARRMTLEVRPSNEAARRLYEDLGFKEIGVRRRYYSDTREDAIIMWKEKLR